MQFRGFRVSVMRWAIGILGPLFASACVVPNLVEYYYMSFVDVPGIKVLEYGKADLWPMFGHEEMPIRYELKRDKYILFLSTDIQVIAGGGGKVTLKTDRANLHVRVISTTKKHDTSNSCGVAGFGSNRTLDDMRERKVLHLWGQASAYCGGTASGGRALFDRMPGVLDHQLINDDGEVVAEERLRFTLVRNGTYLGGHGP